MAVKSSAPGFTICNEKTATTYIETLSADEDDAQNYDLATAKKGAKVEWAFACKTAGSLALSTMISSMIIITSYNL